MEGFRNLVKGWLGKVLLAVLIVPFAIVGVESYFSGGGRVVVAEVNGEKIHQPELDQQVERQRQQMMAQMAEKGGNPADIDVVKLRKQVLDGMINRLLLTQSSKKSGYLVSDATVIKLIREVPAFQEDGKFSQSRYEQMLRQIGEDPASYPAKAKQEMRGLIDECYRVLKDGSPTEVMGLLAPDLFFVGPGPGDVGLDRAARKLYPRRALGLTRGAGLLAVAVVEPPLHLDDEVVNHRPQPGPHDVVREVPVNVPEVVVLKVKAHPLAVVVDPRLHIRGLVEHGRQACLGLRVSGGAGEHGAGRGVDHPRRPRAGRRFSNQARDRRRRLRHRGPQQAPALQPLHLRRLLAALPAGPA